MPPDQVLAAVLTVLGLSFAATVGYRFYKEHKENNRPFAERHAEAIAKAAAERREKALRHLEFVIFEATMEGKHVAEYWVKKSYTDDDRQAIMSFIKANGLGYSVEDEPSGGQIYYITW